MCVPGTIRKLHREAVKCDSRSMRCDTSFEKSKLPISKILLITREWCQSTILLKDIANIVKVHLNIVTDWSSFCREVVWNGTTLKSEKLGRVGKIVEIYESMFGRLKYNRGHRVNGSQVFGGFEREWKSVYRACGIQKQRVPTSHHQTFHSARNDDYQRLLETEGFKHTCVNHSNTFKDPESCAHTSGIECYWRHAKESFSTHMRKVAFLQGSLARYMFWKSCEVSGKDLLRTFCEYTSLLYNGHSDHGQVGDRSARTAEYEDLAASIKATAEGKENERVDESEESDEGEGQDGDQAE